MGIKLYASYPSPPCQTVILVGKCLGLEFDVIQISPLKGETRTDEFMKLNPQHKIPTIIDENEDGFVLSESRAVARYLVDKYAADDSLYPKDIKKRAEVERMLDFDNGTLAGYFFNYLVGVVKTGAVNEEFVSKLEDALTTLETFLTNSESGWVAAGQFTIADISLFVFVNLLLELGINIKSNHKTLEWLSSVKEQIPDYESVGAPAVQEFLTIMKSFMKE